MVSIDELMGLTPYEQGKKLYNSKDFNASQIVVDLEFSWPHNTPQSNLFGEIHKSLGKSDPRFKEYKTVVDYALYKAATGMVKQCHGTIDRITNQQSTELMANYFRDILGEKKVIKKDEIDKTSFCNSTLSAAIDCYTAVAANAMPQLKLQKICFKGAENVDNKAAIMLANSIVAHNLINNTYNVIKEKDLKVLSENAEPMPSYLAEAYDVKIADIKDEYASQFVLSADNGTIKIVPFGDILKLYMEG
jgi:hypothetical protein